MFGPDGDHHASVLPDEAYIRLPPENYFPNHRDDRKAHTQARMGPETSPQRQISRVIFYLSRKVFSTIHYTHSQRISALDFHLINSQVFVIKVK